MRYYLKQSEQGNAPISMDRKDGALFENFVSIVRAVYALVVFSAYGPPSKLSFFLNLHDYEYPRANVDLLLVMRLRFLGMPS